MHKTRHTAGQRVLDGSGNLKAVQKLLGHSSIQVHRWYIEQLAQTLAEAFEEPNSESPP